MYAHESVCVYIIVDDNVRDYVAEYVCERNKGSDTKRKRESELERPSWIASKDRNNTFILSNVVPQKQTALQYYQHFLFAEDLCYSVL